MDFRWSAKELPNELKVKSLSEAYKISTPLATILIQRGIDTPEYADYFFNPKLEHLHDPFLMQDMEKAIARIESALSKREKLLVYGDYDVDGTTAVSIVFSYFRNFSQNMEYYIPDRYKEGYGISKAGIDYAAENGFTLIIALDCGIRSNALVDYAKEKGVDFIICDHHLPGDKIPNAAAVLNPKRSDCEYPYKELSGCGIGYKLIEAYSQKNGLPAYTHEEYLDLVAVSIASDLVDMRGENRILAYFGLKKLAENPGIGLQALMEGSLEKKEYSISDIVFGIGPRINAAGRVGDAKAAVRMLIEKDFNTARQFAKVLHERNHERKGLDSDITREAVNMVETDRELQERKSTVLFGESWHKGVIGIVASRLVEQFYKPTIVFSRTDDMLTGSARSVKDFDIHEAIGACGDLVEQYGGHKYAAGLSIKAENYPEFAARFEEIVQQSLPEKSSTPEIEYDLTLRIEDINYDMLNSLQRMAPFGPGNMLPVFKTDNLYSNGSARVLKDKHLKLALSYKGTSVDGIGFGLGYHLPLVSNGARFSACYSIEENTFNGRTNIQLRLRDIKSYVS
ncbi:MAG: single-stranded-DNA-specific exonuclease RecJ [Bacteroidetes bacterium]|nr:single-stranded-DNA-specific exonuclease RecJ [Bacteroidota bacterium]